MGSGIWATPANVFVSTGGNLTLFFGLWIIAALVAFAGLFCYLELGSIVPKNGGTKVFLEFIYPKPKLLVSVVFSLLTLFFGISLTNAIIFGKYVLYSMGYSNEFIEGSKWSNWIGLILILVTMVIHGLSVRLGVILQNGLGVIKLTLVGIMTITGVYVVILPERFTGLESHFKWEYFTKFETDANSVSISTLVSGLLQCFFTFGGWNSVHTIASEVKDPNRTFKIAGPLSLLLALINFTLMNIAMLKIIPHEELLNAGPLVGSILFEKILGYRLGRQLVTTSIALSSATNVFVVIYALSRMNQEIFREGYLPYSSHLSRNFNKIPIFGLLVCSILTIFWLIILPSQGSSFEYIVSLENYPNSMFLSLIAIGIFIIRRRYPNQKAPIRASLVGTFFILIVNLIVMIAPLVSESHSPRVGFLPPYYITALIMILACVAFWVIKFRLLPWIGGYDLVEDYEIHEDGLSVKKWVKEINLELGI
jgi:amino acid transporter